MSVEISAGLEKLLKEACHCQLGTILPSGWPQVTQVWVDTDGQNILINSAEGRVKTTAVRKNPRVAVNIVDPANPWRVASVRGKVIEVTTEGADQHIDALAKKYLGKDTYPFRQPGEVRVIIKIEPQKINGMGLE